MLNFILNKKQHIDHILDNFDFQRVHDFMYLSKWTWAFVGVPSAAELRIEASKLLNDVYDKDYCFVSTGGFKASKHDNFLKLEFIVSEYSSNDINTGSQYERMKKLKNRINKLKQLKTPIND
jgi:hypothetical protein